MSKTPKDTRIPQINRHETEPLEVSEEQLEDVDGGFLYTTVNPNQVKFTNTNVDVPELNPQDGIDENMLLRKRPGRLKINLT